MFHIFGKGNVASVIACYFDSIGIKYRVYHYSNNDGYFSKPPLLRIPADSLIRTFMPTKLVTVKKYAWFNKTWLDESSQELNAAYSVKCGNDTSSRSIDSLGAFKRRIITDMSFKGKTVVTLGYPGFFRDYVPMIIRKNEKIICTEPLISLIRNCPGHDELEIFTKKLRQTPVEYTQCEVGGAPRYETCYFPDSTIIPYRANLMGNVLTIERREKSVENSFDGFRKLEWSERAVRMIMGIKGEIKNYQRKLMLIGKISDCEPKLFNLLERYFQSKYNMYLVGRMARWESKFMLNDVVDHVENILDSGENDE